MITHLWLSLWCLGLASLSCSGLHLAGTWDSRQFFVFLTKFGFQKTDPKQQDKTQGYIYGNITQAGSRSSTKDLTLVVVDSEYFLEYYGNSTMRSRATCPAMFLKMDQIAFDYICKPKGLEDFLRKVPCPRGKLCLDEDNPANLFPG